MTHWTRKDGTKIALADMTPDHLVNTVRMLHRQLNRTQRAAGYLCAELVRRGDVASLDRLAVPQGDVPFDDADLLDDCVIGGCDRYGSLAGEDGSGQR